MKRLRLIQLLTLCAFAVVSAIYLPSAEAQNTQSNAKTLKGTVEQIETRGTNLGATPVKLQGATNGTIASQGADTTVIQGVNTAGTVRVNNLANLEAILNIVASGGEIGGILWGGYIATRAVLRHKRITTRMGIGVSIMMFGIMLPGTINWLVASARDANLCN